MRNHCLWQCSPSNVFYLKLLNDIQCERKRIALIIMTDDLISNITEKEKNPNNIKFHSPAIVHISFERIMIMLHLKQKLYNTCVKIVLCTSDATQN